jgi:hypothetical protein
MAGHTNAGQLRDLVGSTELVHGDPNSLASSDTTGHRAWERMIFLLQKRCDFHIS